LAYKAVKTDNMETINIICTGSILNIDLSNVPGGTSLTTREDFTIEGDILSIDNISLDISKTEML
jgi:hypothetical protein